MVVVSMMMTTPTDHGNRLGTNISLPTDRGQNDHRGSDEQGCCAYHGPCLHEAMLTKWSQAVKSPGLERRATRAQDPDSTGGLPFPDLVTVARAKNPAPIRT